MDIPLGREAPFSGAIGVLVLHPAHMSHEFIQHWIDSLRNNGRSIQTPVLPCSNENWSDFGEDDWQKWMTRAEKALEQLVATCENVFLAGLGNAGALAVRIAEKHGERVDGIVLIDPALPGDNRKLRKIRKDIDDELYFIDIPILLVYSSPKPNHVNANADLISSGVSSPLVREIAIENPFDELSLVSGEVDTFIGEVVHGFWTQDISSDDSDLIDAEFEAIVAGLSLDESSPSNFLDDLDRPDPDEHFTAPDPTLAPIKHPGRRNAIFAMIVGPIYAIAAAIAGFNPFGIEPWPGVLAGIGGLAYFFYSLQDDEPEDDGAIL